MKSIGELLEEARREVVFYAEGCETQTGLIYKIQDLLAQAYLKGSLDQQKHAAPRTTVFLVTFGDGRPGGRTEMIVGLYDNHAAALDAGEKANIKAGIPEEQWGDSYGAQVDEYELNKTLDISL